MLAQYPIYKYDKVKNLTFLTTHSLLIIFPPPSANFFYTIIITC